MWLDHFPIQSWFDFKDFTEMLARYSSIPFKLLFFHSWPSGITKHGLLDNGLFISDFPSLNPPFSSGIRKSSTNSHTTKPNVTFLLNKNNLDRVQDKASTAEIEQLQPLFPNHPTRTPGFRTSSTATPLAMEKLFFALPWWLKHITGKQNKPQMIAIATILYGQFASPQPATAPNIHIFNLPQSLQKKMGTTTTSHL